MRAGKKIRLLVSPPGVRPGAPPRRLRALLLLLLCAATCLAREEALLSRESQWTADPFLFEKRTVEDGLPQNSVLCLAQEPSGRLWIGGSAGLTRYDGTAFTVFSRWNTPELEFDSVHALCADSGGGLWVAGDVGLARLQTEKWSFFGKNNGLTGGAIRALAIDPQGVLWIGASNGLFRFINQHIEPFNVDSWENFWGSSITRLIPARNGGLWIGSDSDSVYRLQNGAYTPLRIIPPLASGYTASILEAGDGLWVGGPEELTRLVKKENGDFFPTPAEGMPTGAPIRALLQDRNGTIWATSDHNGLHRRTHTDKTFLPVSLPPDIRSDIIHSLLQDAEGTLWMGTETNGLVQAVPRRVGTPPYPEDVDFPHVRCLARHPSGAVWAGTNANGVIRFHFSPNQSSILPEVPPETLFLKKKSISALCFGADGSAWIAIDGEGVCFLSANGQPRIFTTRDGLLSNNIHAILSDGGTKMYIGSSVGLNIWDGENMTACAVENPLSPGTVHINALLNSRGAASGARRPRLLAATRNGLFQLNGDNTLIPFTLDGGKSPLTGSASALWEDKNGVLWIGSDGGGLFRLQQGKSLRMTMDAGLPDNHITTVLEDRDGFLWLGSFRGVCRLDKKQPDLWAAGKIVCLTPIKLDEKDGMISAVCGGRGFPPAAEAPDGTFWFSTERGAAIVRPQRLPINTVPPGCMIESVSADQQVLGGASAATVSLRRSPRVMAFQFAAISLWNPEKIRVFHRLEGLDEHWSETPPRRKRTASYTNLPPGDYRFRVRACNNDGVWSEREAVFHFAIRSANRGLFYILGIGAVIAAAWLTFRFFRKPARTAATGGFPTPETETDDNADTKTENDKTDKKYQTSALSPDAEEDLLNRIRLLMENDKIYLRGDLSLKMVAQRLNVHYNHVSQVINGRGGVNFNDFINKYRIEDAMRRLKDPAEQAKSILEIAYETGFYSKSVFNTAFKKFSGQTPSQFRKTVENTPS